MASYCELDALPPEAFLDPSRFVTAFDNQGNNAVYCRQQYQSGLAQGRRAKSIHIAVNSTWSTENQDGSSTSSYEGIGYHACTAPLLQGFLDSGAPIIVHRLRGGEWTRTRIK